MTNTTFHLAQVNVGRARGETTDKVMASLSPVRDFGTA
jgi:hypothetical protein